jgi:hypothetical protein
MKFRDRLPWINPLHLECETIEADLTPDECIDRLRAVMVSRYSPRTWFFRQDETPVIGGTSGTTFWMQRVHTFVRPWSLQEASGQVEARGSGSVIRICVGMKRVNAVLHMLLGALLLVAALIGALSFPNAAAPWPAVVWLGWPLAGFLFYALDRLWWAADGSYLRSLVGELVRPGPAWHPYASVRTG